MDRGRRKKDFMVSRALNYMYWLRQGNIQAASAALAGRVAGRICGSDNTECVSQVFGEARDIAEGLLMSGYRGMTENAIQKVITQFSTLQTPSLPATPIGGESLYALRQRALAVTWSLSSQYRAAQRTLKKVDVRLKNAASEEEKAAILIEKQAASMVIAAVDELRHSLDPLPNYASLKKIVVRAEEKVASDVRANCVVMLNARKIAYRIAARLCHPSMPMRHAAVERDVGHPEASPSSSGVRRPGGRSDYDIDADLRRIRELQVLLMRSPAARIARIEAMAARIQSRVRRVLEQTMLLGVNTGSSEAITEGQTNVSLGDDDLSTVRSSEKRSPAGNTGEMAELPLPREMGALGKRRSDVEQRAEVVRVVRQIQSTVQNLYRSSSITFGKRLEFSIEVDPDGNVAGISVTHDDSKLPEGIREGIINEVLWVQKFPASADGRGYEVVIPLVFSGSSSVPQE